MSRLSLDTGANLPLGRVQYDAIAEMLVERCPLLQYLHLHHGIPMARTIFERGRWPNLRAFSITGMGSNPQHFCHGSVAQAFIDAHPKLESVDIATIIGAFPITYGRLRHLALWSTDARLQPASDATKHLEHLSVRVIGSRGFSEFNPLLSLPTLRSLVVHARVAQSELRHIKEKFWHVEKLHLKSSFKYCMIQRRHIEKQVINGVCH